MLLMIMTISSIRTSATIVLIPLREPHKERYRVYLSLLWLCNGKVRCYRYGMVEGFPMLCKFFVVLTGEWVLGSPCSGGKSRFASREILMISDITFSRVSPVSGSFCIVFEAVPA